jgi:TaqI-like C-terminal specificity domain
LRAGYGEHLRGFLSKACAIRGVVDFGELPVFESAATFPMIMVAQKQPAEGGSTSFTQVRSLDPPYPDVGAIVRKDGYLIEMDGLRQPSWSFANAETAGILKQMSSTSVALQDYAAGKIYRGIVTGCNSAFVIDEETKDELVRSDKRSAEIIKPLVTGDEVRKWRLKNKGNFLIFCPWDVEINKYPAVKRHLSKWKTELEARPECKQGRFSWWCLSRYGPEFVHCFDGPKIFFPDIARESRFCFSAQPMYATNTAYFVPVQDYYLLAVLNSKAMWNYAKEKLSVIGDADKGGRLRFFREVVQDLPIPKVSAKDREEIGSLAHECARRNGINCDEFEQQIEQRVRSLYGL